MRVLLVQQFFPGPSAPGSTQPRKLVRSLAARGHDVDVLACDINVYDESQQPEEEFTVDGKGRVKVHRVTVPRNIRRSLFSRLKSYLGFLPPAHRRARTLAGADVVVGSIQPLFSGLLARRLARRHGCRWLLEVRDLWPDALQAKGAIGPWQAFGLQRIALSLYRDAAWIVSLTPGIKAELVRKGVPAARIDVCPSGFDPELFRVSPEDIRQVRQERGWGDSFVALYAGAHTEVTAVEVMVRAAAALSGRSGIRLELFGEGQTKAAASRLAQELGLSNISFNRAVAKQKVPALIQAADVGLMSLFRSPLIEIYFENKLLDYMGSGRPILAAMDGMQGRLVERLKAGRVVPSFDHEGLAGLIEEAANNRSALRSMGANGERFVREHLLADRIIGRYCDVVEGLGTQRSTPDRSWDAVPASLIA